jgi:hypothetical protein
LKLLNGGLLPEDPVEEEPLEEGPAEKGPPPVDGDLEPPRFFFPGGGFWLP